MSVLGSTRILLVFPSKFKDFSAMKRVVYDLPYGFSLVQVPIYYRLVNQGKRPGENPRGNLISEMTLANSHGSGRFNRLFITGPKHGMARTYPFRRFAAAWSGSDTEGPHPVDLMSVNDANCCQLSEQQKGELRANFK